MTYGAGGFFALSMAFLPKCSMIPAPSSITAVCCLLFITPASPPGNETSVLLYADAKSACVKNNQHLGQRRSRRRITYRRQMLA